MTLVGTDGTERSRSVIAGWVADAAGLGGDLLSMLVKSRDRVIALSPDGRRVSLAGSRKRGKPSSPTATVALDDPRLAGVLKAWVGRRDAVLRVDHAQALVRHFEVPARAAVHLPGIVTSRLGQLSPLPADQVVSAARIAKVDQGTGQAEAQVFILPRARFSDALEALTAAGPKSVRMQVDVDGDVLPVAMKRSAIRSRGAGVRGRGLAITMAALVAAALAALAADTWHLGDTDARMAELRAREANVRAAIQRASTPESAKSVPERMVADAKAKAGSPLDVLENLAVALPDHTFATTVAYDGVKLRVTGRSSNLPDAMTALEQSGQFTATRQIGPATRLEETMDVLFVIETTPKRDVGVGG
jgi:Tfp pilus assembly protein PilN